MAKDHADSIYNKLNEDTEMKIRCYFALQLTVGTALWVIGNVWFTQMPAWSQEVPQGYPVCTSYVVEGYSRGCGNQVNGQCSGTWYDSYWTVSSCQGNSGTGPDCHPGTTPDTNGTSVGGSCYPVQGGDPPVCQPGPAQFTGQIDEINQPQCYQVD